MTPHVVYEPTEAGIRVTITTSVEEYSFTAPTQEEAERLAEIFCESRAS